MSPDKRSKTRRRNPKGLKSKEEPSRGGHHPTDDGSVERWHGPHRRVFNFFADHRHNPTRRRRFSLADRTSGGRRFQAKKFKTLPCRWGLAHCERLNVIWHVVLKQCLLHLHLTTGRCLSGPISVVRKFYPPSPVHGCCNLATVMS